MKRGEITSASLTMVPLSEGTGTLTLTVNWPQENQGSSLILNNPILDLYIKGFNAHGSVYEDNSSYTKSLVMPGTTNFYTTILLNMPPGWYEIQTRLYPNNATGMQPSSIEA